ncbi:MAG TPA: hypothetical protein VMU87_17405 [Stellaceae bacterium]|nr:hypothetical protein [Stellaceae bacterium]
MRQAARAAGCSDAWTESTVAALRPAFEAIERARGKVEAELAWALLAIAADRARRGVLNQGSREPARRHGSKDHESQGQGFKSFPRYHDKAK